MLHKYNIAGFPWKTFLLEGKIIWYNHQPYRHIKTELNDFEQKYRVSYFDQISRPIF